jgi:hypothetical protein
MSYKSEDVAEAERLVNELKDNTEGLRPNEKSFVEDLSEKFDKYGEGTFISHNQLRWLRDIYERVIG